LRRVSLSAAKGEVTCILGRNGVGKTSLLERVIRALAESGNMAILLVEQYFDFVRDLAAAYLGMQRGEVVASGRREDMDEVAVRSYLTV
jgi:ABC-type branched-subunit amino acid transport system ATPase component